MGRGFSEGRGGRLAAIGLAIFVFGVVGGFLFLHWLNEPARIAAARDWNPPGVPCVEVSAAAFAAQPMRRRFEIQYGPMTLTRAASHGECTDIAYRGGRAFSDFPVCRFMSPIRLQVRVDGRDHFYLSRPGQGVTVSMPHGQLVCRMAPAREFHRDPRELF